MSLSLPYDPVFVPLDVLTAEELNEITSNINYISNQFPIGTDQITAGAITSSKLGAGSVTGSSVDYTSVIGAKTASLSMPVDISSSFAALTSVDISSFPTGSRLLVLGTVACSGSDNITAVGVQFVAGSLSSAPIYQCTQWWKAITPVWSFTKTSAAGSRLYLQAMKDNSYTAQCSVAEMIVLRIG